MIKNHCLKILFIGLIFMSNLQGKPIVVDRTVLFGETFDTSKIHFADLYINKDNTISVEVANFLWINNSWSKTDEHGFCLNGFVADNRVHLAFKATDKQHIDIYDVGKDFTLENHVTIEDISLKMGYWPDLPRAIYVPGDSNALYLLSARNHLPTNPFEVIKYWLSGGHGILYDKPILAKIQGQDLLKFHEIPYGGKTDESYRIKKALTGKDTIHLIGFRTQEQMGSGFGRKPPTPVTLHYAKYNVNKQKLISAQDIYEDTPRHENGAVKNEHINYSYGALSADNLDDENIVVVFSWIRDRFIYKGNAITEDNKINSQIYFAQCGSDKFGGIETIGEGFIPLVRVDSIGNVHIIWVNNNGSLIHKVKKDNKWSGEEIFLSGVDNTPSKMYGNYICAEFDKNDVLNIIFPSNGNIVLAKVKFD